MIYAEDINGNSIHIDDAVKGVTYYFKYEDKEYEIIVAQGEKNIKHYKTKRGEDIDVNIIFHKDCQKYLKEIKVVNVDNLTITCDKVLLEAEAARYIKAKIPDYSMRPDCLFLDSDGEIMCIVEVNVTHKKSNDDIKKIEHYKIPTIELTYGKRKDNHKQPIDAQFLYLCKANKKDREIGSRIYKSRIPISNLTWRVQQAERERAERGRDTDAVQQKEIRELEREITEEEGYITSITNLLSRCMGENYKKRLEDEQRKQS
jgi:hypothetical protein